MKKNNKDYFKLENLGSDIDRQKLVPTEAFELSNIIIDFINKKLFEGINIKENEKAYMAVHALILTIIKTSEIFSLEFDEEIEFAKNVEKTLIEYYTIMAQKN